MPLSPEEEQVAGTNRGRHLPGRRKCAGCPRMAAIRRMYRGSDGRLFGSSCARKRGLITPRQQSRGRLKTLNDLGARIVPDTLFDQQPAREQPDMSQLTAARRFVIERGDTRILDGILWPDGTCSLRWRQAPRSFVSWDSFDECVQIQVAGVPGARVVWVDDPDGSAPIEDVRRVRVRVTKFEKPEPAGPIGEFVTLEPVEGDHFTAHSPVPGTDEVFFMAAWFDGGRPAVLRLPPFSTEVGTVVDAVLIAAPVTAQ